jgi:hypothetical protein
MELVCRMLSNKSQATDHQDRYEAEARLSRNLNEPIETAIFDLAVRPNAAEPATRELISKSTSDRREPPLSYRLQVW